MFVAPRNTTLSHTFVLQQLLLLFVQPATAKNKPTLLRSVRLPRMHSPLSILPDASSPQPAAGCQLPKVATAHFADAAMACCGLQTSQQTLHVQQAHNVPHPSKKVSSAQMQ